MNHRNRNTSHRHVNAKPQLPRRRPLARFGITPNADATNASLRAHIEREGKAELGIGDSPWSMSRVSHAVGIGSVSPEQHYPTMTPKALRDFQFGEAFAKDAVIGFWVINGQVDLAIDMLRGQGFRVKTLVTWHKVRSQGGTAWLPSTGAVKNCSEILIIAACGRGLPLDKKAKKFPSMMTVERTTHSTKPAIFREMLAELYPLTWDGQPTVKLELFARHRAKGWKAWGNQAPTKVGGARRQLRRAA